MPVPRRVLTTVIALTMALVPVLWPPRFGVDRRGPRGSTAATLRRPRRGQRGGRRVHRRREQARRDRAAASPSSRRRSPSSKAKAADAPGHRAPAGGVRVHATRARISTSSSTRATRSQAARRTQLLDHANERDNDAVRKLAAINEDLRDAAGAAAGAGDPGAGGQGPARGEGGRPAEQAQRGAAGGERVCRRSSTARSRPRWPLVDAARQRELEAERAQISGGTDRDHRRRRTDDRHADRRVHVPGLGGSAYTDDYGGGAATAASTCSSPSGRRRWRRSRARSATCRTKVPAATPHTSRQRRERLLLRPPLAVRGRCALGRPGRDHRAHRE